VYVYRKTGQWERWETSTRILVGFFAALITLLWIYKIGIALLK